MNEAIGLTVGKDRVAGLNARSCTEHVTGAKSTTNSTCRSNCDSIRDIPKIRMRLGDCGTVWVHGDESEEEDIKKTEGHMIGVSFSVRDQIVKPLIITKLRK